VVGGYVYVPDWGGMINKIDAASAGYPSRLGFGNSIKKLYVFEIGDRSRAGIESRRSLGGARHAGQVCTPYPNGSRMSRGGLLVGAVIFVT